MKLYLAIYIFKKLFKIVVVGKRKKKINNNNFPLKITDVENESGKYSR